MDSTIIIVAILALLIGAVLTFFLTPKTKDKTEINSDKYSKKDTDELEKKLRENLNILQNEKVKLEKRLEEKNNKISKLLEPNLDDDKLNVSQDKKLLIEISQLKDEIEDLEDEIKDLEKRNKKTKEEVSVLDNKLYTIEKEKKDILESNNKNIEKLVISEAENKKQKESLSFISDILNANNAVDEKFQEVDQKTWDIFSLIKNELKPTLEYFNNNLITDNFIEDCWSWRNQEIKTWIKNKKVVAIVGEFSAGKTSIVNRILKQDNPDAVELPVKSTETTAIPTYISNGVDFNCQFYSPSGDLKNITKESFQKVTKSVLDEINISSIVKYFVLSYNNKNLSDISILDTPGFGSNSEEIITKTTEVIKEADALFWVVDANTGEINNSSVNVIKDNLQSVPLYIIINKSDGKSPDDLEILRNKIKETLNKNDIKYQDIIFFSNKMEIDELMDILNHIEPQKSPEIITQLNEQIDITLKKAKVSQNRVKKEFIDIGNDIDDNIVRINQTLTDFENSLIDMDSVISFESPFFGKDHYRITESNYGKFNRGMDKISSSREIMPSQIDGLLDNNKNHSDKLEEKNELKYFIDNLDSEKIRFLELINSYNPKLLK
ncbi:dynamin family protein [Polaribacter sp. Z014]|uniref:dynamin family protein n=1 Tax=Polaribacter sp. Z014 TaxID=2927126 RepID=UPI002021CE3E|nr:dynamin family protein [Polaribacter sp. Z014]MCL7765353.1 dynamin family protein [Polaribacter sp. Z014]